MIPLNLEFAYNIATNFDWFSPYRNGKAFGICM